MIRRTSLPITIRKKSENTKITPLKNIKKSSKSPNLPKKHTPENVGSGAKPKSVTSLQPDTDVHQYLSHSAEELDNLDGTGSLGKHPVAPLVQAIQQENGTPNTTNTAATTCTPSITTTATTSATLSSGISGGSGSGEASVDDFDGSHTPDPNRTKAAKDHLQAKIHKIMVQIKSEQDSKEAG
ncbi:uncharacterized protein LOC106876968 isoform X1 [Octopus bimaculoides]|uniref:uncharacterized protein LOC106876968 isoform X1 n=1 Tax=Octopus bimaculoides TaxID=37653 RepID=UPI0022E40C54|nr:uncharacterized protein LOC106876968 isoform X1 [Octopus bimaculoides]